MDHIIVHIRLRTCNGLVRTKIIDNTSKNFRYAENKFNEIIHKLPIKILVNWESLEFTNNDERIIVCKEWLNETLSFDKSYMVVTT